MASFGDTGIGRNVGLPLPDEFSGEMEQWQDWSWQVKAYVSVFETKRKEERRHRCPHWEKKRL